MSNSRTIDILLVDDREDSLLALEALLSPNKNYKLIKARSGPEAVSLLPEHDFAMVLLDVQMPGWDGFKTAQVIRGEERYKTLPIVFVTAIDKDERYIYQGYESGAVDYIFKPFDPVILQSKVSVFADLHRKNLLLQEQARKLHEQQALAYQAHAQAQELENLRRYQNLANAIPHMIWRATPEGMLEYDNKLWNTFTGLSSKQSQNDGWLQAFCPEDMPRIQAAWSEAISTGNGFEMECRISRWDGVYRWHWIRAVSERNTAGHIIAWTGTATDIEDRKATESKLKDAQKQAEAASKAKTHFLANMSHEIRTPLNAIIGFTELMLNNSLSDAEKQRNFSIIQRNNKHLLRIIDEILDISKIEAGGLELESVETNLPSIKTEMRSLLEAEATKKSVQLDFSIDGIIPEIIFTDSTRLRQILLNVIGNAIKFASAGGLIKMKTVFEKKQEANGKLIFTISDTGSGIDPSFHEKIFQPFSQGDASTTRTHGGTGLGLALSRKLAQALGGNVFLKSSLPGQGSIFVVEIATSVAPYSAWTTQYAEGKLGTLTEAPMISINQELSGTRILLVEDAEDNQILIQKYLQKSGALIDVASDGQEGIQKALSNDYAVVLMDIQMPLLDGHEATARLRKAGYTKPIIALTAHALRSEREKCLRMGCSDHLTKPIDRKKLIERLLKYVGPMH